MTEKFKYQLTHKGALGCGKPAFLISRQLSPYELIKAEDFQHLDGSEVLPQSEIKCDSCGLMIYGMMSEWIEPITK